MKKKTSIIIPVFHEQKTIRATIDGIDAVIKDDYEILIIYDLDDDPTVSVVKNYNNSYIKLIKNQYGRGALNALKTGINYATGQAIIITMADGSDDPQTLRLMLKQFSLGADVVCASRYMPGGKQIGGPWFKKQLSRFACLFLYYSTNVPTHDITNSFKLYRKSVLNSFTITSSGGFELGMELTVKAFLAGYRVTQVPTVWHDRAHGVSNFKLWSWIPHYSKWALLLFFTKNCISRNCMKVYRWVLPHA